MAPQRQLTLANGLAAAGLVLILFGSVTVLYAQVQRQGDQIKSMKDDYTDDHRLIVSMHEILIRMDERETKKIKLSAMAQQNKYNRERP